MRFSIIASAALFVLAAAQKTNPNGNTNTGGIKGKTPEGTKGNTNTGGTKGNTNTGGTKGDTNTGGTKGNTNTGGTKGNTNTGGTKGKTTPGDTPGEKNTLKGKPAPRVTDNPAGVVYMAALDSGISTGIKGGISAVADPNGGVKFRVKFTDLPQGTGPFSYHIHTSPVTENCEQANAHLDPFGVGDAPCDPEKPATCQVGDLSGKHGKIDSNPYTRSYVDDFASTKEGNAAFIGHGSIVIHDITKKRIACANFRLNTKASGKGTGKQ